MATTKFKIQTQGGLALIDITERVNSAIASLGRAEGVCVIFVPHATAALIMSEHENGLLEDLKKLTESWIPQGAGYRHDETDRNAHAHLRSTLFGQSLTLPVERGKLALGLWQSVFFLESDVVPRSRTIMVTVVP